MDIELAFTPLLNVVLLLSTPAEGFMAVRVAHNESLGGNTSKEQTQIVVTTTKR